LTASQQQFVAGFEQKKLLQQSRCVKKAKMARKLGGSVTWARSQAMALPHHPMSLREAVDVDMADR
jgi:hypothetical protein